MQLLIGENIRRLRRELDVTQECLAKHLGVSTQAVSKWERGEACPDITLLPGLAGFFGVSLDDLMGMDTLRETEEIDKLIAQAKRNLELLQSAESIEPLQAALRRFPNHYGLMHWLGQCLCEADNFDVPPLPPEQQPRRQEATALFERVLAHCTDAKQREKTQASLFIAYDGLGDAEKARAAAKLLPALHNSREVLFGRTLYGEERATEMRASIETLAHFLVSQMKELADPRDQCDTKLPAEERILLVERAIAIYEIVFPEEKPGGVLAQLAMQWEALARLRLLAAQPDFSLDALEQMAAFSEAYDARKAWPQSLREEQARVLRGGCFDTLRAEARFIGIMERLDRRD